MIVSWDCFVDAVVGFGGIQLRMSVSWDYLWDGNCLGSLKYSLNYNAFYLTLVYCRETSMLLINNLHPFCCCYHLSLFQFGNGTSFVDQSFMLI